VACIFAQRVCKIAAQLPKSTGLAQVNADIELALVPQSVGSLKVGGVVLRESQPASNAVAELHLAWHRGQDNPAFRVFRNLVLPKPTQGASGDIASSLSGGSDRRLVGSKGRTWNIVV
jgi:hypothetical protein